jgi:hypothetical protein
MGYASPYTIVHHMKRLGIKKPDGWHSRPSGYSPDFKQYFEDVIKSCQSVTEAMEKLGYARQASVRYNMKRFGIKTPNSWYSQPDALRRPRDAGFRAYFEGVVKSSKSVKEVVESMHYTSPNSVWYQMKKQGIRTPDSWYGHPPARSKEFAPYFENVVKTSKTVGEAVQRLGYANPSMIWHHLKRLGVEEPAEWSKKPGVSRQRLGRVPEVALKTEQDKSWVAALHQGEGAAIAQYSKKSDDTSLVLSVAMTDSAPIFKFCDLCGRRRPERPAPRPYPWKPIWIASIGGLRAFRVLQEILPYLVGEKLGEAKRALDFFAPDGYRKGRHTAYEIWPEGEFLLRKRGASKYAQSLRAKEAALKGVQAQLDDPNRISLRFDRTCLRIADVLVAALPEGRSLVEIMDESGASWTAVIHHLKHLQENSLVSREEIQHMRVGPRLNYRARASLKEMRGRGWIPESSDEFPFRRHPVEEATQDELYSED